ncbi:sodium:solute symporter family protein [Vampirovibrio chlorellavorus]|uniref:sodium:solute symporter family protein n=1 Tax=Vampirovibrio chlorellavorus TaxID=758823 RepID=UPI0026EE3923|nr:sodium:solute symporter family protein [Vampirovibrio chlorellavorus]
MNVSPVFLLGYFVVILLIARFFSRRVETLKDFFLAGRQMGAFPVALTLAASWFGASSTMGSINAFHHQGLSGAWQLVLPSVLSFVAITLFMAKPVARQSYLSQPEAVAAYYGKPGRFLLACIILAATTTLIGSQMVAAGQLFHSVFGLDLVWATVLSTLAVVSYAMWGGYFTVVITDIAQMVFIVLGFLILLVFTATTALPDAAAWQHFLSHQPPHFWDVTHGWQQNIFLVITFVLAWCIAPEMWQRMSSTKNPELAFKAGWQALCVMVLLFSIIVIIGLLSTRIIDQSDAVLIDLALKIPVPFFSALVLLGFLSAVTSTMDSSLNVGSLTLTRDIYQGFLRPQASNQELIRVSRIATVLMVLPAMALALAFKDLIHILWISADIYASGMFVPVVGMLYLKNPPKWSGVLAMGFGISAVILSALTQNGILPNVLGLPGWPYSTLIGIGLSGLGFALGYAWQPGRLNLPERQDSQTQTDDTENAPVTALADLG